MRPFFLAVLMLVLCAHGARAATDYLVVAQDGSGDFTTVQAAILAVPDFHPTRTTIFIRAGTYKEKLAVPKQKHRVTLLGEDRDTTILTYDDHATVNPDLSVTGTSESTSTYIKGKDFAARDLTFSNTAGDVGPAIAVWVQGNRAHFRNCAFLGYQDTVCTFAKQAYFKKCYIEGAVDMIFGGSTSVFQQCTIYCLGMGFITAADTDDDKPYGFVFKGCTITGSTAPASVFLGRPWGAYANVAYVNCSMSDVVVPEGWDDWDDEGAHETAFFAEYNSSGTGGEPASRVGWSRQLTGDDVDSYRLRTIFHLPEVPAGGASLMAVSAPWYTDF